MPKGQIHDTAFVISCYRASDEALSLDSYSKHWKTAKAQEWVRTYTREVSSHEPFVHCLRNRFFLDQISAFFRENPGASLVNVGCGFSAYPHLLPASHSYCDVDLAEVVQFKQKKLAVWERDGTFPFRNINYVATDLNDELGFHRLEEELRTWLDGRPSFILIEGVVLFLTKASVVTLFEMFARLQQQGDRLGSVSFVPEIRQTAAYVRFLDFYRRNLGRSDDEYTELEDASYRRLPGYTLLQQTDYLELSRHYIPPGTPLNPEELLNEHLYILERA